MTQHIPEDVQNWKKWYSIMISILILVILALILLEKMYN